jgi:hypothetical protein
MHEIERQRCFGFAPGAPRGALSRKGTRVIAFLAVLVASSCSKEGSDKAPPAASSGALPLASASAAPASSVGKAPANEAASWAGSYTAKVGAVIPPENAKEKTWADDPGSAAVGKGTALLNISGARGDTRGELTGPLGDLLVSGVYDGKELRANLTPKDPKADTAMTGFMVLAGEGTPPAALKGTLRVSGRDARIVREASVELAKK